MMDLYVQYGRKHKGLFNLMIGPRIDKREAYEELATSSTESFQMFEDWVCQVAKDSGWGEDAMYPVTYAAWAVEHGVATLLIADRVPRPGKPINFDYMVRFSLSLLIASIAHGPEALQSVMTGLNRSARPPKA